jgi:hypothetical protein
MKRSIAFLLSAMLLLWGVDARADSYSNTVTLFKNAGESAAFFQNCYGYAVFPTIGKGGLIVGAAHGRGRVYVHEQYVGDTSMTQLSIGLQAGGQAYSQIIFFEDQRAVDEFTNGNFEFGADVSSRNHRCCGSKRWNGRRERGRQRRQEGRVDERALLQRFRGIYDRERRRNVPGIRRRAEVQIHTKDVTGAVCAAAIPPQGAAIYLSISALF